jgi:hypothetical protein
VQFLIQKVQGFFTGIAQFYAPTMQEYLGDKTKHGMDVNNPNRQQIAMPGKLEQHRQFTEVGVNVFDGGIFLDLRLYLRV